jgi:serine/threonine protein kinase
MNLIGQKFKDYHIIDLMKKTKSGNTYICADNMNKKYSLKVININNFDQYGLNINNVNNEIEAIKFLSGYVGNNKYELRQGVQYVVKYINDFDEVINGIRYKFIVMEYIDGIDLEDFIKVNNNVESILKIIYQLMIGLNYMHKMNYAHRDITPNNVMITKNGHVKYLNYGFACRKICNIGSCNDNCTKTQSTLKYLPPEVITKKYSENIIGAKAWDIWQLSLTIFNLCNNNKFPYVVDNTANKIKANIIKAPYINSNYRFDDRINVFVNKIIVNNWVKRPNTNLLILNFVKLFSEYFNDVNNNVKNNDINNNVIDNDINNNLISNGKKNYEIVKELGRGGFGITYLALDKNKNKYAIKTLNLTKNISKEDVDFEIETLKDLSKTNNKYVVKYYDTFKTKINNEDNMCIVMEFIDGSSFRDFIVENTKNNKVLLKSEKIKNIFNQLIQGLKFIHSINYAHRDIKPENIMITKTGDIKYIDYGLACLQKCKMNICTDTCENIGGTPLYQPPEVFLGLYNNKLDMAKAWDIWSLTLTMYELCNGSLLFPYDYSDNQQQLYKNITKAPYIKSNYQLDNGQINQFLDSIIVNNWKQRPTIEQLESLYSKML